MKRAVLMIGLLLLLIQRAVACSADIDSTTVNQWIGGDGRGYDIFDTTAFYQPLTLRVHGIDGACPFYISAAPSGGGSEGELSGPGGPLRFSVYRDVSGAQILSAAETAVVTQVLTGALSGAGDTAQFQIAYSIAPQQVVAPGDYSGQIALSFYEGNVGAGILRAQQQVPLTVHIPATTDISFAEGAFDEDLTTYTIPFGMMHEGDMKGVALHARSNAGYRILLRSENGGVMRHQDANEDSTVPYTLSVDGRATPLARTDQQAILNPAQTGPLGQAHRLDFKIGSTAGVSAGEYQDVITITVLSLQ
jgi:spore coat protein U-like protein